MWHLTSVILWVNDQNLIISHLLSKIKEQKMHNSHQPQLLFYHFLMSTTLGHMFKGSLSPQIRASHTCLLNDNNEVDMFLLAPVRDTRKKVGNISS